MMLPTEFIGRLKCRCAKLAIAPSTLRGKGTNGLARATRRSLDELDLTAFAVNSEDDFRQQLEQATHQVYRKMPANGRAWGRARKALNIFLRDLVYNVDLSRFFQLSKIRRWLEVPLDSFVAKALKKEPDGANLPGWCGVKNLTPALSMDYQGVAKAVGMRYGVCRIDLDIYYSPAAQLTVRKNDARYEPSHESR